MLIRTSRIFITSLFIFFAMFASPLSAQQERIISFDSAIQIAVNGDMTVTETIRVQANGQNIQRGIFRDFPTQYRDRLGNNYEVDFNVLNVRRDGQDEPWRTERIRNGVRVYIGRADVFLSPGEYSYQIDYQTDRQLGFFENHDELYWNVTGNDWAFPIENVSATISLPTSATVVPANAITMEGFTGLAGSTAQFYTANVVGNGASIESTVSLNPREGLTFVMTWPKGIVTEPTVIDKLTYLLKDNRGLLLSLLTLIAVIAYLCTSWSRVGRDPEAGVIFPHYEPPKGYSPASTRYILKMKYDNLAFTAAIINLAVHGHLTIAKEKKEYTLSKMQSQKPLAPGEKVLLEKLFSDSDILLLDDKNRKIIVSATDSHRKALKKDYLNIYFSRNTKLLWPPVLGSLLMFITIAVTGSLSLMVFVFFACIIVLHFIFAYLLQAPSTKGRLLMDKLEGFKLYLEVAEKDDLNLRHPPELTPQLFERYLPFAIALGVEQVWAEQFAKVFAALQVQTQTAYHPVWYAGAFHIHQMNSFTNDVSKGFSKAIAVASTPPSSSSGTGGGGFSGGGGGGGGGGGW